MNTDWLEAIRKKWLEYEESEGSTWPDRTLLYSATDSAARRTKIEFVPALGLPRGEKIPGSLATVSKVVRLALTTAAFRAPRGAWRIYQCRTWKPGIDPAYVLPEGRVDAAMLRAINQFLVFAPKNALVQALRTVDWPTVYVPEDAQTSWQRFLETAPALRKTEVRNDTNLDREDRGVNAAVY